MTQVRTACTDCGTVAVSVEDITVRCCDDVRAYAYRFRCPECVMVSVADISLDVAALLLRAGAFVEHWRLPLELRERPTVSDQITVDELVCFCAALDQLPTADRFGPDADHVS